MVELGFNGLCFEWVLMVYVSMHYFGTFQAEMWVDLRCCCRNPTLAKCGGEAQHLEKVRIWSPPGLSNV
jgi:hypothetical protein